MPVVVAPYDPLRRDEIVGVLARAFFDDPLYRWLWPDQERRKRGIVGFITAETRLGARLGRVDVALDHDGRVVGAALWALPGRYPFAVLPSARAMAGAVRRMGWSATGRLPLLKRVDGAHPRQPHWYLITVGVEPEVRGRGVGRTLILATAAQADREGLPIYLETFNPANPPYYRALGFADRETVERRRLPTFWTMLRPPGAAAAG